MPSFIEPELPRVEPEWWLVTRLAEPDPLLVSTAAVAKPLPLPPETGKTSCAPGDRKYAGVLVFMPVLTGTDPGSGPA